MNEEDTVIEKIIRDSAANFTADNPILPEGALGIESDTYKKKLGDGVTNWNLLNYIDNPIVTCDYPAESDVKDGVAYDGGEKTGSLIAKNQLPPTGQTDTFGFSYDDGFYQDGSPISPRFVDNGDNTIKDNVTNLQWIKRPELIIPDGLNSNNMGVERGDYAEATAYAAGDIATKNSDSSAWICLIAHTSINPVDFANATPYNVNDLVYDDPANGGDGTWYQCAIAHTSTEATVAGDNSDNAGAWNQIATDINSLFDFERTTYSTYWEQSIWATSNGGGGVNPVYMVWDSEYGSPDALSACQQLTKSGKADWRLPNLQQLVSIVDYGNSYPAIDTDFFPNTQNDYYWSSTIYAGYSGFAWFVNFLDGFVGYSSRYFDFYVRPCRQY